MINFVLDKTSSSKLVYIGHSMGTTALFTMLNLHPEMGDRISSAHLLAPGNKQYNLRKEFSKIPVFYAMIYGDQN